MAIDYWHDVDLNWGATAHIFFTEDGIFDAADQVFAGRKAIQEFYSWRKDRGSRSARHLISNMKVELKDDSHATAIWIMSLYAADGTGVLPSNPPIMIADVIDECEKYRDGVWHYRKRTLRPVFTGGAAPTVPKKGELELHATKRS
jgi:hypothetical protein